MNYQQTLDYLYAKLPMFTRIGSSAIKKDLTNTLVLCEALGNPQKKIKTIHVAGTNGKGSVSHMLAAIMQTAGYKTALYTSPHLKDFRERIKIDGDMISREEVISFVKNQQKLIEQLSPSFFEVTVAMAFNYFAKENVDIAIIEVGLGGRLDSTNIIIPEVSVITNISLDHTDLLGKTLPEIAFEKAGIIKNQIPVIIGELQEEVKQVFIKKATDHNATIKFASEHFYIEDSTIFNNKRSVKIKSTDSLQNWELNCDLTGSYQLKNILTVLATIDTLQKKYFTISDHNIITALANVKNLTGLMGRWQTLNENPLIICDTGHNEGGIKEVIKNIEDVKYQKLHMVIGMVKDKDIGKILSYLPINATYYFCAPNLPRAKPAEELKAEAAVLNLKGNAYNSVGSALESAKSAAHETDFIFIGGSTFVVAEVV